jgi:hypothetical protein
MKKRTLKFTSLIEMAKFSKLIAVGYLMNTNNFTLTANFSDADTALALEKYNAIIIETTDKVFSYEVI